MTTSEQSKTSRKTKIDGGYGWVIVFAAFMIHFIVGGILYTLGVLYTEFLKEFGQGKGNTAWINSFVPGTMMSVGPIAGSLTSRFGCRVVVITGAAIATTGFVLCSFATSIFYLYFTFVFLPGVGFGFIALPTLVCVNRHFEKKRSLAIGLAACGTGIGIFAFAPLVRFLINEYGWRGTSLFEAGISFNVAVFGAFLRPMIYNHEDGHFGVRKNENRPPISKRNIRRSACTHSCNFFFRHFEFSLLKEPVFLIYTASNILTALGYFVPYTYLPDRAEEKGIVKSESAFLISTMEITNLLGRLLFGWLADHKCVNRLLLYGISLLIYGIANFLNPVDDSYEFLLVYAAIEGLFGGTVYLLLGGVSSFNIILCYSISLRPVLLLLEETRGQKRSTESVFIGLNSVVLADLIGLDRLDKGLGLLQAFTGIGDFLGPPITGWLYDGTGSYAASFYFAGCCVSLGGIVSVMIPVQQRFLKKSHQPQLDNNRNLETNQTKF